LVCVLLLLLRPLTFCRAVRNARLVCVFHLLLQLRRLARLCVMVMRGSDCVSRRANDGANATRDAARACSILGDAPAAART
jgi:hypothetical protein